MLSSEEVIKKNRYDDDALDCSKIFELLGSEGTVEGITMEWMLHRARIEGERA